MAGDSYYEVLTAAVNDISEHGFDSAERVAFWSERIKEAAQRSMTPPHAMEQMLRDAMAAIYQRMVDRGEVAKFHPGIARFTIERLRPQMRAELDRRILASAGLIKLNKEQSVQKTLQRFQGWATSIPAGGSDNVDKREEKTKLTKALRQLPFEERRVLIDQGHKLTASINEIVATDGGAIALRWHSRWRQAGYDYREDHKERDGKVYLLRDSWAKKAGLVKSGDAGYYDDVTAVAEEPFCRCNAVYIYNLRSLPLDMLTVKGKEQLLAVQAKLATQ